MGRTSSTDCVLGGEFGSRRRRSFGRRGDDSGGRGSPRHRGSVSSQQPRRARSPGGRPALGSGPSEIVTVRLDPDLRSALEQRPRCRLRDRRRPPSGRRRQPGPTGPRALVCSPVRIFTGGGLVGQDSPAPAQPGRRPAGELGPVADRDRAVMGPLTQAPLRSRSRDRCVYGQDVIHPADWSLQRHLSGPAGVHAQRLRAALVHTENLASG